MLRSASSEATEREAREVKVPGSGSKKVKSRIERRTAKSPVDFRSHSKMRPYGRRCFDAGNWALLWQCRAGATPHWH